MGHRLGRQHEQDTGVQGKGQDSDGDNDDDDDDDDNDEVGDEVANGK